MESSIVHGDMHLWDGKDQNNLPVSSGIYLIVANSEDGQNQVGKVAIIR